MAEAERRPSEEEHKQVCDELENEKCKNVDLQVI